MTHPPIAPKSMLMDHGEGFWLGMIAVFYVPGEKQPDSDRGWRTMISAVAEVEWLKRAERWKKLEARFYRRECVTCAGKPMRKTYWSGNAQMKAKDNAKAWRAWGEQN